MIYSLNKFLRGHFVSFCIVFLECSSFYFHPELYRFLDLCFSVSSSFILLLNIKHQCHWRNMRTISLERTNYIGGSRGMLPRKKKQFIFWLAETPYPAIPGSNAINSYLFCCASLSSRFSSLVLPEPKYKDSWLPSFKIKDSWFLQVL